METGPGLNLSVPACFQHFHYLQKIGCNSNDGHEYTNLTPNVEMIESVFENTYF